MIGIVRLVVRTALSLACVFLIIIMMSVTWSLGCRRTTRAIMQGAFIFGAWVWGIHIRTSGTLAKGRPLIVVSNHFTYLDLFVLGSHIPAAFTPKSEIRSWPVIGLMCLVSGCLFIDRRSSQTLDNKQRLQAALAAGDIISLFPEGTTNDGTGLQKFKSSFFSLAEESAVEVQPVSIVYTALDDNPLNAASRPVIGWYGDSEFFPHAAHYLQQKSVRAELVFHSPVRASDFASRKELALHCQSVIEKPLQKMIESLR